MATFFAGAGIEAFTQDAVQPASEFGYNVSNGTRSAIQCQGTQSARGYCIDESDGTRKAFAGTVWLHFRLIDWSNNFANGYTCTSLVNSGGVGGVRFDCVTGNSIQLKYWNGATYVNAGAAFPWLAGAKYDLKVKIHASAGEIVLYQNQLKIVSVTGVNTSGVTDVAYVNLGGTGSSGRLQYTEVVLADYPTLGLVMRARYPTGDGANTAWTGGFTDVDEDTASDIDIISSGTAGQKETYVGSNLSALAVGYLIKGVVVSARIRRGETGPQNAKTIIRIGSTDYVSPFNMALPDTGYEGRSIIASLDPSTGVAWASVTNVNSQFGLQSVA